jgi:hypothetical protein
MTPGHIFKLACVVIYAIMVVGLTIVGRMFLADGPHAQAARPIRENQIVADADLRPVDQKDISGHFALREFAVGNAITARDVAAPSTPPLDNTVAAVITMHRPSTGAAIEKGASVQVCLDEKPSGKPSKVAMAVCGDKVCLVTIPLDEWPLEAKSPEAPHESAKDNKNKVPPKGKKGAKSAGAQTSQARKDSNGPAEPKPLALPVKASRLSAVPEGQRCDGG